MQKRLTTAERRAYRDLANAAKRLIALKKKNPKSATPSGKAVRHA
jgi:hypothetical protein